MGWTVGRSTARDFSSAATHFPANFPYILEVNSPGKRPSLLVAQPKATRAKWPKCDAKDAVNGRRAFTLPWRRKRADSDAHFLVYIFSSEFTVFFFNKIQVKSIYETFSFRFLFFFFFLLLLLLFVKCKSRLVKSRTNSTKVRKARPGNEFVFRVVSVKRGQFAPGKKKDENNSDPFKQLSEVFIRRSVWMWNKTEH